MSEIWKHCLSTLRDITPVEEYIQWLQPIKAKESKTHLTLSIRDTKSLTWVNSNIKYTIKSLIGKKYPGVDLNIVLSKNKKPNLSALINKLNKELVPEYTFENLVIGDTNEFAHYAARQIAQNQKTSGHSPFIIYGDCGIGKTHLLHAIGHLARQNNSDLSIIFTPLIDFVRNITTGIRHQQIETIKKCYQAADLLLVDDIHHIAEKEKTQEEFFYVFDYLFKQKKQIILTCDQVPNNLKKVEERLISRFNQGLTLPIKPPGLEMRAAILINKAERSDINLSEEAALFIASKFTNNVRELEGALNRLKAVKSFTQNNNLSIDEIEEALDDLIIDRKKVVDVNDIQKIVCRYYGINSLNLLSKKRTQNLVYPRQMAIYLTKELTNLNLSEIGNHFKRDHTTVIHADKKIQKQLTEKFSTREDYKNLKAKIYDL